MMFLWILVLIVAAVAEAVTTALVSVWFCVGAFAAAIAAAFDAPLIIQLLVFVSVSIAALLLTKPIIKKFMPQSAYVFTNGENDVGRTAYVVEEIDGAKGTGRVKLGDVDWGARSEDGSVIKVGTAVIITGKGAATLSVREAH
ncbi:MAG: NfeD family protein [Oscillospiraceae bacterium]|nr:NfeD family protein [Oscillospiraceae bacterium]